MYKELFTISYEDLICYIEDINMVNKILDIIKYLNFFNQNGILNLKPEETNFNMEIENIISYENYTNSEKRTEIIYLVIEESTECLNSMGIKLNDVVKISLTDIYNIVFTIYNSLLDTSIKELDFDNNDELIDYIFNTTESYGTDYNENITEITPYFVNNYNKYKKDIIEDKEDYSIDNKIVKLISMNSLYCTTKVLMDYLNNDSLNIDKDEYLLNIIKDNSNIDKIKLELSAFIYIYYTEEEYIKLKDNFIRLLSLYNIETIEIDNIMNYIETRLKDLRDE
jgi:hypothetical protein